MEEFEFIYDYPIISIIIYRENIENNVKCILDSGSPYTILPDKFLKLFNLSEQYIFTTVEVHGIVDKEECSVDAPGYEMGIKIGKFNFPNETVLKYKFRGNLGLIGHNILSKLKVTIDWRKRTIEID